MQPSRTVVNSSRSATAGPNSRRRRNALVYWQAGDLFELRQMNSSHLDGGEPLAEWNSFAFVRFRRHRPIRVESGETRSLTDAWRCLNGSVSLLCRLLSKAEKPKPITWQTRKIFANSQEKHEANSKLDGEAAKFSLVKHPNGSFWPTSSILCVAAGVIFSSWMADWWRFQSDSAVNASRLITFSRNLHVNFLGCAPCLKPQCRLLVALAVLDSNCCA